MSRSEEHAAAVGRDVDVLGDIGAKEEKGVEAVLTFDGVVAVARVPDEHVVARAQEGNVVAVVAEDEVVAVAADQDVVALAADDESLPAPPSIVSFMTPAGRVVAVMLSSPSAPLTTSESFAPSALVDVDLGRQPSDRDAAVAAPTTSIMSSPLVPFAMTVSLRHRSCRHVVRGQIDVDLASHRCRSGR